VLAMYVPSFFTGFFISRFGAERIVAIGLTILAAAGMVALTGVELATFFVALMLLGVGWNFGFIGTTTMLAQAYEPEERLRLVTLLKSLLTHKSRIVQVSAMEALTALAEASPALKDEVIQLVKAQMTLGAPSVVARGRKLLSQLTLE